ncbi:MAG: hypothetical protein IT205_00860 [Fimbriimonadaceae bacterium]|nr:hypothetical protein [Fimbriimonadaceae bacterium]
MARNRAGFGVCAFMDSLGSSELYVELSQQGLKGYQNHLRLMTGERKGLRYYIEVARDSYPSVKDISFQFFSDSTFLYAFAGDEKSFSYAHADVVIAAAEVCARYQVHQLVNGRLLRGGLAHGEIVAQTNALVGLPVYQAAAIESSAKHPAIVLAKQAELYVRSLLMSDDININDQDLITKQRAKRSHLFLYLAGGQMIVNPFAVLRPTADAEPGLLEAILKHCHDSIKWHLLKFTTDERRYSKYAFMRDLFNFHLLQHTEYLRFYLALPGSETASQFFGIEHFLDENLDQLATKPPRPIK